MELRHADSVDGTIDYLRQLHAHLGNVASGAHHDNVVAANEYLQHVEAAEHFLSQAFLGTEWVDRLLSERYWRIRDLNGDTTRPWPLLSDEVRRLQGWLSDVITDLDLIRREDQASDLAAIRAVLDTNVFLQFRPYKDLDWRGLLKAKAVRIIVPMAVIRELDVKKTTGAPPLGGRARRVLRMLHNDVEGVDGPVAVRAGVTLEVLRDPRRHVRQSSVDQEILARSESLTRRRGGRVILVTGDLSMRLQADAHDLAATMLPDNLRLPDPRDPLRPEAVEEIASSPRP